MFKKALIVLTLKCCVLLLTLSFNFIAAKYLGLEQYGLFALATSIVLFTVSISKFGLEQIVTRMFATKSHAQKDYLSLLVFILASSFAVALVIYFLGLNILPELLGKPEMSSLFVFVAILGILQTVQAFNASVLKGLSHAVLFTLLNGFVSFSIGLILLLVLTPSSAFQLLTLFIVATLLSCLFSFFVTVKSFKMRPLFSPLKFSTIKKIVKPGANLLIVSLCALITQQFSVILVSSHVTLEDVAIFALALKISFVFNYPLVVSNSLFSAKYANLFYEKNYMALKRLVNNNRMILLALAVIGFLFVLMFGEAIIAATGQEFVGIYELLVILILGQCVNLATGSSVNVLVMAGYEKIHRKNTFYLTVLNVVALYMVIPQHGVMGAAVVTSLFIAIKNTVSAFFVNRLVLSKVNLPIKSLS